MSGLTKIEWADVTWNPFTGCTPVSEGCEYCYAKAMANRRLQPAPLCPVCGGGGLESPGIGCHTCDGQGELPPFTPTFHPDRLDVPLRWRKPRRVFVCSMSDLFHEAFKWWDIDDVLNVIDRCPSHTFMVLTKRPERMRGHIESWLQHRSGKYLRTTPPRNLWLGVTAENQQRAEERIPVLLDTPASVRFVSVEPMLGPVDLTKAIPGGRISDGALWWPGGGERHLDWVIVGGETGPGARPMQSEWAIELYRQCQAAGVSFFFKKWGRVDARGLGDECDEMAGTREFPTEGP